MQTWMVLWLLECMVCSRRLRLRSKLCGNGSLRFDRYECFEITLSWMKPDSHPHKWHETMNCIWNHILPLTVFVIWIYVIRTCISYLWHLVWTSYVSCPCVQHIVELNKKNKWQNSCAVLRTCNLGHAFSLQNALYCQKYCYFTNNLQSSPAKPVVNRISL